MKAATNCIFFTQKTQKEMAEADLHNLLGRLIVVLGFCEM